jgi:hypothetical protein
LICKVVAFFNAIIQIATVESLTIVGISVILFCEKIIPAIKNLQEHSFPALCLTAHFLVNDAVIIIGMTIA